MSRKFQKSATILSCNENIWMDVRFNIPTGHFSATISIWWTVVKGTMLLNRKGVRLRMTGTAPGKGPTGIWPRWSRPQSSLERVRTTWGMILLLTACLPNKSPLFPQQKPLNVNNACRTLLVLVCLLSSEQTQLKQSASYCADCQIPY